MRWPWTRAERPVEARAAPEDGYTAQRLAETLRTATGALPDCIAIVEALAGTWERGLAAGRVVGAGGPAAGALTPAVLAMTGRALLLRGEIVFAIEVRGGRIVLAPCSDWDVWGRPDEWDYRVQVPGPSATEARYVGADAVVHFRIGADHRAPWRGRSPLHRARVTADVASALESAMDREARLPVGRIFDAGHANPDQLDTIGEGIRRGGVSVMLTGSLDEKRGQMQSRYGPGPDGQALELRAAVLRELAAAAGVSAILLAEKSDGTGAREAYRRFLFLTLAPVGELLLDELRAKLELPPGARFDWSALAAADLATRARAYGTFRRGGGDGNPGMTHEQAAAAAGIEP